MFKFIEFRHILAAGRKCHAAALRGKPFCFHHAKLHFRNSPTRKSRTTQPSLEDLRGLRKAVAEALEALCSPLVDTRRAGLLLYGFNLAANLSKRVTDSRLGAQSNPESGQGLRRSNVEQPAL